MAASRTCKDSEGETELKSEILSNKREFVTQRASFKEEVKEYKHEIRRQRNRSKL